MKIQTIKVINVIDPQTADIKFTGTFEALKEYLISIVNMKCEQEIQDYPFLNLSSDSHIPKVIEYLGYVSQDSLISFTKEQLYKPLPNQYEMFNG